MISVIIPTFNRSRYLVEAVDSALSQTGTDVEVVVVDDGSTDQTSLIVERRASSWGSRFRYIWQDNAERCVARNHGLVHARGDFVAFLDSDDVWVGDHLRFCLDALEENPAAVAAYGEYGLIAADGGVIRRRVPRPISEGRLFLRDLCLKRLILHPSEVVIRREAILPGRGPFDPEIPGGEDWLFWVELSRRGVFCRTGRQTVWMRVHPNGTFGEPFKFTDSLLRTAEKVSDTGLPRELGISKERIMAINMVHCSYAHYLSGHWPEARHYLFKAFRCFPGVVRDADFWKVMARLSVGKTLSRRIRAVRQRPIPSASFTA